MGIEITVASIVTSLLISAAVSAASYGVGKLLAPKPSHRSGAPQTTGVSSPDPLSSLQDAGGPLPGLFGHRRVAGKCIAQVKSGTATYAIYVIAGAPVTGIDGIYLNNNLITVNGSNQVTSEPWANTGSYSMTIKTYDGTQTTVDATLDAALTNWTSDFVGKQIAWAWVKIDPAVSSTKFANTYAGGIPDITFHVRGFKCYDPRDGTCVLGTTSTYIFSVNPSVIEANYMIHVLGANFPTSIIDWASVTTSANVDDTAVTLLSGGSERSYTACLYWSTDETHESVLARIGAAHAGGLRPIGSKYVMLAGSFPSTATAVVPDDDTGEGLTGHERGPTSGRVNGVRGQFVSPSDNYEKRDFPLYQSAADLALDNSREEWLELNFDCVTSHTQAQRLARIAYLKARGGYQATLTTKFKHFNVTADDVMSITDTLAGLTAATFRVQAEELGEDYTINFTLAYETAAMYAWTAATDEGTYTSSIDIQGETGDLRPPGGALIDTVTPGGTITPNFTIWRSPSAIANADHYRFLDNLGTLRWTGAMTATVTANATAYNAAASIAGNWTLNVEDVSNVVLTSMTVAATGTAGGMSDFSTATTTFLTPPASPAPSLTSLTSGSANLFVPDVTYVSRATHVRLYSNTTPDSGTATLVTTTAVSASGITFAVTGTPGTLKYYWAKIYVSDLASEGPVSKPVLVVF